MPQVCSNWTELLATTRFESLVRDLSRQTLAAASTAWPHSLRCVMVQLEREGAFMPFPGLRLLVNEVDADTEAEEAALAQVRRDGPHSL